MIWWTRPAWWIGRFSAPLRASVHRDTVLLQRLWAGWLPPLAILAGLGWGLLHPGMVHVYTESGLFLGTALALGSLAPSVAVLFVLAFAGADLVGRGFGNAGGRLVADWLLWVLAVQVPLACASFQRELRVRMHPFLAGALAALMAGLLVLLWELGMPLLLRPVFTWQGLSPSVEAYRIVHEHAAVLPLAGVVLFGMAALLRARVRASTWPPGAEVPAGRVPFLVAAAFALVALSGIVSGPLDLLVLAAGLFLIKPAGWLAASVPPVRSVLERLPRAVRFVLAFVMVCGLSAPFTALAGWLRPTEWFPIVLSVALGMLVFSFMLAPAPRFATLVLAFMAAGTEPALADNFSSWSDAFGTAAAGAATAAGAIAGGIAAAFGCGESPPPAAPAPEAAPPPKEPEETPEQRAQRVKDAAAKAARDHFNDCADSVAAAAEALGIGGLPDPETTTANDQIDYMAENWTEVDMARAKELADAGDFVVAGKKGDVHGHTAVVVTGPGVVREEKTWPNVAGGSYGTPSPPVETPGKAYSEGGNTLRDAWGGSSRGSVKFYTPKKETGEEPAP